MVRWSWRNWNELLCEVRGTERSIADLRVHLETLIGNLRWPPVEHQWGFGISYSFLHVSFAGASILTWGKRTKRKFRNSNVRQAIAVVCLQLFGLSSCERGEGVSTEPTESTWKDLSDAIKKFDIQIDLKPVSQCDSVMLSTCCRSGMSLKSNHRIQ